MKLLIMGIQGSGKGTQAKKLAEKYGITHISTGELLRDHIKRKTEIGLNYEKEYEKGNLAPDYILFDMIQQELNNFFIQKNGFILDGFPRTWEQLEWLCVDQKCDIDKCIHLTVPEEISIKRMMARNRKDDNIEAIRQRISDYHNKTATIVRYYIKRGKAVDINGNQPVEDVFRDIKIALNSQVPRFGIEKSN